jgi:GT2 family glycosyltransferase
VALTPEPDVTLVIVTFNSARHLPGLVASLPAALAGVPDHEVVVADNASTDGTRDAIPADVRVVALDANVGYSAAINRGFAASPPRRAVFVLNPDLQLGPGSVRRLLAALDQPGVGIAVPRIVGPDGSTTMSLRREPAASRAWAAAFVGGNRAGRLGRLGEMITDPACYEKATTADWASGAAMLISRECLDAVGPWDESLFLYAEETDFALRARDAGFGLTYVPDARVMHVGGEAHTDPALWSLQTVNRVRLVARRNGPVRTASFHSALVVNEAIRSLGGSDAHRDALVSLLRVRARHLRDTRTDSRELLPRWPS